MRNGPFSKIFYPENIVIIGVSPEENNLARNILLNTLNFGYRGEVLSVGLKGGVACGQRIHRTLDEISKPVDLAVILTPARSVPSILEQCGRKGIRAAVIESGGFSELGPEGIPLEKGCREAAERYGIRFIGPNGIGVTNLENGLVLPFMPLRSDLSLGSVSILAQSGGVGLSYLNFLADERIGINKFVSMGNKLNVDENELLAYLIEDPGTKIILVYLEGFTDGRKFVEIASRSEKPILVHKSNRFETSAAIAHSHTTALFVNDRLVDYALEQAGCVRVNTLEEAVHYIKSLTLPPLRGKRLAVVSRSGGHAIIAADACGYYGFELPPLPGEMLSRIQGRLRAQVIHLQNPLDLGDLFELDFYQEIMEDLLKREDLDGVLLGHGYRKGYEEEPSRSLMKHIEALIDTHKKPIGVFVLTEASEREYLKRNLKIPIFDGPEKAVRAFHLSHQWWNRRPLSLRETVVEGLDHERVERILEGADAEGRLPLRHGLDLLSCFGFRVPPYFPAKTEGEAAEGWMKWKSPVAMKVNAPHLSHKSDQGAVRLNLRSEEDVRTSFRELRSLMGEGLEVLVQKMAPQGREVILGGKRDDCFGPVLLFGLGGIFVEVFRDVVWRLAPIQLEEAGRMVQSIMGARVLSGYRGEKPRDVKAIQELLVRLSQMLVTIPRIQEIDVNPLIVFPEGEGAEAVDARVILG